MSSKLFVSYGQDASKMVQELLETIDLKASVPTGACIGLKPNLAVAKPSHDGATTDPKLVEGVIRYLQSHGFDDIAIMEGSWIGDSTHRAFKVCGYSELAEKYNVALVDLQKDGWHTRQVEELELRVCDEMSNIDYLINFPVLKGHCQTKITCALKNLKGCIPDQEKRRFHSLGLHKPIAYLNKAVKGDLVIVDGIIGDLDFEEGGNPVQMDRIIVGTDPVLVDSYVANLLGYEAEEIPYITLAASLGVGEIYSPATKVERLNEAHSVTRIAPTRDVLQLAQSIIEDKACSACYGSLVHALARLRERGMLERIKQPISIGQGFQGQKFAGLGVGICTRGATSYVSGCPPSAKSILDFLYDNLD